MARKGLVHKLYGPLFNDFAKDCGAQVFLTAVIHSNAAAKAALIKRSAKHPDKPFYAHLRDFTIQNVQFTTRKKRRETPYTLRRATQEDIPRIATLLHNAHEQRPFGYVFTPELLRFRLERWPGLQIEDFYLAWKGTELVGVTAPWDAHSIKRFRVLGYYKGMRWVRTFYNVGSKLMGYTPLPPVGGLFRYFYLTHLCIPSEDPAILAALVDRIYEDYYEQGYHFFSVYMAQGDPLRVALKPYRLTGLPATLYAVSVAGSPFNQRDLGPARVGFEMALV